MSEIKIYTLVSGPPIIGKVSDMGYSNTIEDPFYIVSTIDKDAPGPKTIFKVINVLALSSDDTITIKEDHILFSYGPLPEIVDQYNAMCLQSFTKDLTPLQ